MNATDVAAWWGAIAATVAIIWDVVKWSHGGPRINVQPAPNMVVMGGSPLLKDDNTYISVRVTNTGDQKTTITNLVGVYYDSFLKKALGKGAKHFIILNPALASAPLPFGIGPGEQWSGSVIQTQELEERSRNGFLYVGVGHTSSKEFALARVRIPIKIKEANRSA